MTLPLAIAIVLTTLIVGSAAYALYARYAPHGGREHQTPTSVYAVTAGAMSLLIAFTLSLTFTKYLEAQEAAAVEAEAVLSMSRAATLMDPKVGTPLRNELVCYAQEVINVSWPAVRDGDTTLQMPVRRTLNTMDSLVAAHPEAANLGLGFWESANQQRLGAHVQMLQIAGDGVPWILWLLLIGGSLITIGSLVVYADRGKPTWGHVLVVIGPLFVASAALVVIAFFDHPFVNTPGGIQPTSMELALDRLTTEHIANLPLPYCPHKV